MPPNALHRVVVEQDNRRARPWADHRLRSQPRAGYPVNLRRDSFVHGLHHLFCEHLERSPSILSALSGKSRQKRNRTMISSQRTLATTLLIAATCVWTAAQAQVAPVKGAEQKPPGKHHLLPAN